jgi:hypothetical protein
MSRKTTLISFSAAAAALALFGIGALRRSRSTRSRPVPAPARGRRAAKLRPRHTDLVELPPRHVVLPLAFWDAAAELDTEDDLPLAAHALGAADEGYDSMDLEDASTTWLARATQSGMGQGSAEIDDPAEIAADSMSMVSEASRLAAGADPSGFEDSPPSQRG